MKKFVPILIFLSVEIFADAPVNIDCDCSSLYYEKFESQFFYVLDEDSVDLISSNSKYIWHLYVDSVGNVVDLDLSWQRGDFYVDEVTVKKLLAFIQQSEDKYYQCVYHYDLSEYDLLKLKSLSNDKNLYEISFFMPFPRKK